MLYNLIGWQIKVYTDVNYILVQILLGGFIRDSRKNDFGMRYWFDPLRGMVF